LQFRDGAVVDRDHAANVLDGSLSAQRHVVGLLGVSIGFGPDFLAGAERRPVGQTLSCYPPR
jgi:hypothetical protein